MLGPDATGSARNADGTAQLTVGPTGAILRLAYNPAEVDPSWEQQLQILEWREDAQRWATVGGIVDTINHAVSAPVVALGFFTLGTTLPSGTIHWTVPAQILPGADASFTAVVIGTDGKKVPDGTLLSVDVVDALALPPVPTGSILSTDLDPTIDGVQIATRSGKATLRYRAPSEPGGVQIAAASVLGNASGQAFVAIGATSFDPTDSAGTLQLSKGRVTIRRSDPKRDKYALQGQVQFSPPQIAHLSGGDIDLTIRDGIGEVEQHVSQGLQEIRPGRVWKFKARSSGGGLTGVTIKATGTGYRVKIRGSDDLSALAGSHFAITLRLGTAEVHGGGTFAPFVDADRVSLKFP